MKRIAGLLVLAASPLAAADAGRVVDVTVFRDRAEVARERTVQLPAGASTVEFAGLPLALEARSVRVTASGAPASLGAIEIVPVVSEQPTDEGPELRAAKDEVLRIERAIAELDAGNQVDKQLRNFLANLGQASAEGQAQRLPDGKADPTLFRSVYELMATELGTISGRELDRAEQKRQLELDLIRARERVSVLRPEPTIRTHTVSVGVDSPRGGSLTLRVAYLLPGAWWQPTYRATLADDGEVALSLEGVVRQTTGEDWSGVQLRLSSASPTQTISPPQLDPWKLEPVNTRTVTVSAGKAAEFGQFQNTLTLAPGVSDADQVTELEVSRPVLATMARSAYAVAFDVAGASDVPSDGRDHRVALTTRTLKANPVHRTVPASDPRAFLTAVTTSPENLPLLAGQMRMFAEDAYLGAYTIKETGPGVELVLPFGVDNRVEIVRVPLPRQSETAATAGRTREVQRAYKTEITNLLDRAITIVVEDRYPVSDITDIDVELLERETTAGYEPSARRAGVLLWTLELAAGEKRELTLAFRVRHPSSMPISGL